MTAGRVKSSQKMFDLAAQFFGGKRLDESFRGGSRRAIEFRHLRGGRARHAQGFAFGRHLAGQSRRKRLGRVDAASGQKQIADDGVSDIAFQARNAAEARDQSQAQFRETEARHFVRDDQIAGQWPCGVTPQSVVMNVKPKIVITPFSRTYAYNRC